MQNENKGNREVKASAFTAFFSMPENAAKLYGALNEKEEVSPEDITYQTLSHWISILEKNHILWRSIIEFNYFSVKPEEFPIEITQELYHEAWSAYWNDRDDGWGLSVYRMKQITDGGKPHKVGVIEDNVFEEDTINELKEILQEEIHIS